MSIRDKYDVNHIKVVQSYDDIKFRIDYTYAGQDEVTSSYDLWNFIYGMIMTEKETVEKYIARNACVSEDTATETRHKFIDNPELLSMLRLNYTQTLYQEILIKCVMNDMSGRKETVYQIDFSNGNPEIDEIICIKMLNTMDYEV